MSPLKTAKINWSIAETWMGFESHPYALPWFTH